MHSSSFRAAWLSALLLTLGSCAALTTKTQWNVSGDYVNFPFGSPYPPYVLRTTEGDAPDRIVVVSGFSGNAYTFSAYDAATGQVNYTFDVAVPPGGNSQLTTVTSGLPSTPQQNNSLAALFLQIGSTVVAVNPTNGQQLWTHATYNQSTPKITGHSDPNGGTVYLTSPYIDTSRPVPTPLNYIQALDAATGQLRWANFTPAPPPSGVPVSDTAAAAGVTALPDVAVYCQGARMYGLSAADGRQLWSMAVTTGSGFGGSAANVSSITYLEPGGGYPAGALLLQSTTYEQMRFMVYSFNGTTATQPVVAWQNRGPQDFEGTLRDDLARLGLAAPAVSPQDATFVIWSNRTAYDLQNGGKPVYSTWLVARSTANGNVVWAKGAKDQGWSELPMSPPSVYIGVASVVTGGQVLVFQAGSGQGRFQVNAAPVDPQAAGGQRSYMPVTSFANNLGQLVALRCLDSQQPGSLCAYNGYDREATDVTGAARVGGTAGGGAVAAIAGLLAAVAAGALG